MSAADSPSKRHRKHKKHKHKKHKADTEEDIDVGQDYLDVLLPGGEEPVEEDVDVLSSPPTIKLKIKLGGETMGTSSVQPSTEGTTEEGSTTAWAEGNVRGEDVFLTKKPGDDTSDEEREWLDALEAGTLDDSGALKKHIDPSLMTARQRARISGKTEEPMMELPSGYKTTELTEEQLQRRQQRAKKRREQAMEKQEKDKKQTLDRLLKKQQAKMKGGKNKGSKRAHHPAYRYSSNQTLTAIYVPPGFQFPFPPQSPKCAAEPTLCGVLGCHNPKKYSCSKTGVPLCSLECYRTNLQSHPSSAIVTPT